MTDLLDRLRAALSSRYTIERELGSGGMATVYLAQRRGVLYLAADADGTAALWVVPVGGGPPRRLLVFDSAIRLNQSFAVHRDTIFVTVTDEDIGIQLAELSQMR